MAVKTISTEVIVRRDCIRGKNKSLDNLASFDEAAWCQLCKIADLHTLLVNALSERIQQDPAFVAWILKTQNTQAQDCEAEDTDGLLPHGFVKDLCRSLAELPPFHGMSGRFYTSAIERVEQIFESWIESRQKLINRIKGKQHFLSVVEQDIQLAKDSNFSQLEIENKAEQILAEIAAEQESNDGKYNLFSELFNLFEETQDLLGRRAIIYLLTHSGKVQKSGKNSKKRKHQLQASDPMAFAQYLETKRTDIEQLTKKLSGQLPRARNLFPDLAFEASLENLIALPDPDSEKYEQYCFLVLSLLIHQSNPNQNVRLEKHLLQSMELQQRKLDSTIYYRVLLFSLIRCATSQERYLQLEYFLIQAIKTETERIEAQFYSWKESIQPQLNEFLREPKSLPYPIKFSSDDVRSWQTNQAGKIFFKLNGWKDLIFEVRCDRRQLPLIQTFLKDWQTKKHPENKDRYSGSLMALRSIELAWKPRKMPEQHPTPLCADCEPFQHYRGKGFWNECQLSIHWTYDLDALTLQGSKAIRQRKLQPQLKKLAKKQTELEKKQEQLRQAEQAVIANPEDNDKTRELEQLKQEIHELQADLDKPRPKLDCLQNTQLFDRPDRPPYEGEPNIFVGVLLDLEKHVVVTVVDARRRKVLAIRSSHSLSPEGYQLLPKYFRQRREHAQQRQEDQKEHRPIRQTESGLGQQIARLFARDIVKFAQQSKASTIVIPETTGWRERLHSQVVARAKIECNGCEQAMKQYTKAQSEKLHQWDYRRLSQAIIAGAESEGLKVILQKTAFEENTFQQAATLAISAYDSLNLATG